MSVRYTLHVTFAVRHLPVAVRVGDIEGGQKLVGGRHEHATAAATAAAMTAATGCSGVGRRSVER